MMPCGFEESNGVLDPPEEIEGMPPLSVLVCHNPNGVPIMISCWKLTAEELDEIVRTSRVWLMTMGGKMPPVCVCGVKPFAPHQEDES